MQELSPSTRLPPDVEEAARDPSRHFGPFILVRELGRGAVGVVHLAYDLRLHRRVALKTLTDMSPEQFERFQREGRAAAKLEHPGIVRVLDLAVFNGRPYIAMEVVEGRPLRAHFREQSLRTRELVSIMRDVAEALGHAHAQGIVHRDVKPGNIFVDSTGHGRIMDFGVARDTTSGEALTATGQTLGTPEYMSPEQASDPRNVSPRSDVYALGAVIFEGLTGRPPFIGATPVETMFKVLSENVIRPSAISEVPLILESVVLRSMDRDPEKRFKDGLELAQALEVFLVSRGSPARKPGATAPPGPRLDAPEPRSGSRLLVGLVAFFVAGGLAEAAVLGVRAWREDKARALRLAQAEKAAAAAAAAQKKQEEERRLEEEKRRAHEATLREALATRDPAEKAAKLGKCLEHDPHDVRALVARAAARVHLAIDARHRLAPTGELEESIAKDLEAALAVAPASAAALVERAHLALVRGKSEDAQRALSAAARPDTDAPALYAQLLLKQRAGRLQVSETDELTHRFPDFGRGWLLHGLTLERARRFHDAADVLARSVELEESPDARLAHVQVLEATRNQPGVVVACNKWLEAWPGAPLAVFHRALARIAQKQLSQALEDGKILREGPRKILGLEICSEAHAVAGEVDAALEDCTAALASELTAREKAQFKLRRAQLLFTKKDFEGTMTDLLETASVNAAAELRPAIVQLAGLIARELIRARGDTDGAEEALKKVADTPAQSAQLEWTRSECAIYAGDLGAAREHATMAQKLAPGSARTEVDELLDKAWNVFADRERAIDAAVARGDEGARLERAAIFAGVGEMGRAREEIERVIATAKAPRVLSRAYVARARLVPEHGGRDIEKALAYDPDSALAIAERGVLRARTGQEVGAREDGDRAVALAPTDPTVRARRAEALLVLGDLASAAGGAREALAIAPTCRDALVVLYHVDKGRGDGAAIASDLRALAALEPVKLCAETLRTRASWLEKGGK